MKLLSSMNWIRWYCSYSLLYFVLHRDRFWDHACQYEYGFGENIAYWSNPRIQRCIKSTDVLQFSLNYHIRDIVNLLEWCMTRNKLELQRESLSHGHIYIYIYIYIYIPSTFQNIRRANKFYTMKKCNLKAFSSKYNQCVTWVKV
jgi:hypothetical protein